MKGKGYLNVLSLGLGKQSSYLLLKNLSGEIGKRVDYAIFSDTGCEPSYVYSYLKWLRYYCLKKFNFKIDVIHPGNLLIDINNYYLGLSNRYSSIPAYVAPSGAPIRRQCTYDYKIRSIRKFSRQLLKGKKLKMWIGISYDEMQRMKISDIQYIENYYPLVEEKIKITDIKNWYPNNNFTEPGKSSCFFCPFHSDKYWFLLKKHHLIDFEKACNVDKIIRNHPKMNGKLYLHKSLKPLSSINFSHVSNLFSEMENECEGMCGI
jgi:hypothetical protein